MFKDQEEDLFSIITLTSFSTHEESYKNFLFDIKKLKIYQKIIRIKTNLQFKYRYSLNLRLNRPIMFESRVFVIEIISHEYLPGQDEWMTVAC